MELLGRDRCFMIDIYICLDAIHKKEKVKEADLYSAFTEVPYTQGAQVRITQCYLQIYNTFTMQYNLQYKKIHE